MADVEISYRGNTIASMSASGTKTLQTQGKYCDDDIIVTYSKSSALKFGDPLTIASGSATVYTDGGVTGFKLDGTSGATRRSLWQSSGDHVITVRISNTDYSTSANVYPIEIPSGATKINVSIGNGATQAITQFCHFDGAGWPQDGSSGWEDLPIQQASIPAGATHVIISLRVNSSNTQFTEKNAPRTGTISFE